MENLSHYKRSQRLIYITEYFLSHPSQQIQLRYFIDLFQVSKSTISEDVSLIRDVFEDKGCGTIRAEVGASGGLYYQPHLLGQERRRFIRDVQFALTNRQRILPGNYISLDDILEDPYLLNQAARLIADYYNVSEIDAVMTVETNGVALAVMVAHYLRVKCVIARRDSKDTVGPTISINYVSGSHQEVRKMELPKNSLQADMKVLIVDDFLRNGGTIQGLTALLAEFNCKVAGICLFAENSGQYTMDLPAYDALFNVQLAYNKTKGHYELQAEPGEMLSL